MNKVFCVFTSALILATIAAIAGPAFALDPSADDLTKKLDATQTAAPSFVIPQITPVAPQIPRTEKLTGPISEKIKAGAEEQIPADLKESILKAQEIKRKGAGAKGKDKELSAEKEQQGLSALEKMITSDEILEASKISSTDPAKTLSQFGYNFFRNTSFEPMTAVPVSDDYLIGAGDVLVLNLWGSIEGSYELTVSNSGEVLLPKGGPVKVVGMPFGRLPEVFRQRLNREFRDYHLSVNMGKLSTIKVYVVGEVASPGDYSVSSLSTLLNALSEAGGPTKNGSLRNIKIRHAGRPEESIDLYEFFTRGDKSRDIRLRSGDTIFVPVVGRVAAIAGNVKRPAIYELKDEKTLQDLLALAEGPTATGYLQRVQISRVVANQKKRVLDLNLDSAATGKTLAALTAAVPIQDMDIVRVFAINDLLHDHFSLEGHVDRPGYYALKPGLRLSDVLKQDHFLPEYYPSFVEVTRLMPPDLQPQKMVVNLGDIWSLDPSRDLEIKEFDVIRVFSKLELERQPMVKVSGEVQNPGEYRLFKEMRIRDLLIEGGYPTPSAYLAEAEISRLKKTNDKVTSFPLSVNLVEVLKGDPKANFLLEPFDELTIRKIPNWAEETERYVTLSGEFRFPGVYPIYKGERLSSVIERAGGFSDKAYLPGAKFSRASLRELQQKRMDEALSKAEAEVAKKQADLASVASSKEEGDNTKTALEGLQRNINILKTKRAEGRLVIKLTALDKLKNTRGDVSVEGGDALFIPSDPDAVSILGQVYNPTSIVFEPHSNVGYYLDKVGGPTGDADGDEIYLVKMDGTVISKKQSSGFFNSFMSRDVDSGDTIIVPQEFEKIAWVRDIKDIATILGQTALAAGVLIAAHAF